MAEGFKAGTFPEARQPDPGQVEEAHIVNELTDHVHAHALRELENHKEELDRQRAILEQLSPESDDYAERQRIVSLYEELIQEPTKQQSADHVLATEDMQFRRFFRNMSDQFATKEDAETPIEASVQIQFEGDVNPRLAEVLRGLIDGELLTLHDEVSGEQKRVVITGEKREDRRGVVEFSQGKAYRKYLTDDSLASLKAYSEERG